MLYNNGTMKDQKKIFFEMKKLDFIMSNYSFKIFIAVVVVRGKYYDKRKKKSLVWDCLECGLHYYCNK